MQQPLINPSPVVQGMRDFHQGAQIRQCKIIGTLGPSSSSEEVLRQLVESGLNIARLNFSHGDHEMHRRNIDLVRKISKETKYNVSILQDLQGPKIRCGYLLGDGITLQTGAEYILTYGSKQTDPNIIPIDHQSLASDVQVGARVMMDDGLILLEVTDKRGQEVIVRVIEGGFLKNRKGVNFPDSILSLPPLSEKDNRDLLFGVQNRVDMIAMSFVQTAQDILACKKIIAALGADIPVVAKIEKLSAIECIDEIAAVSDALMVARGDLGVEGRVERVPIFQRKIIAAATRHAKPVIIATQMLESMIQNPRASIAEVADVANAVLDGADCVMLSAECASGKFPVQSVQRMAAIIRSVEKWSLRRPQRYIGGVSRKGDVDFEEHEAIALAACEAADTMQAKAIVCLTLTGSIAKLIARWRPNTPVIAISPREDVILRLGVVWGVYGMVNPLFYNTDVLLQDLPQLLKSLAIVKPGDTIVITAGIPMNAMRSSNMIKINVIK